MEAAKEMKFGVKVA